MSAHQFSAEYLRRHFQNDEPWLRASRVPGADPTTYRVLNHAWSVDRHRVYLRGRPMRRADPGTFVVLNELYARDRSQVFCSEGRLALTIDLASFEVLDEGCRERWQHVQYIGYAKDAKHVYFGERPRIVSGADPSSFEMLPYLYARDRNVVYRQGRVVAGADPATIEIISEYHAKDNAHVFHIEEVMQEADPATFNLLDEFLSCDARHVYDRGRLILRADPLSFELLGDSGLALDRNHVFALGELLAHVDRQSFQHLRHAYFADRNAVYWYGKPIAGADRASFIVEGYNHARDRHRSYVENRPRGQSISVEERAAGSPSRTFGRWAGALLKSLVAPLLGRSVSEPRPAREHTRAADMKVLASVLANGDQEALAPVLLAIDDMDAFQREYLQGIGYADEPDFAEMLDCAGGDPQELHPFDVLETVYHFHGLFGAIDWRSDTDETIQQIDPMLRALGVCEFDWSFIDVLTKHGDGSELRNHNFLTLLQERLESLGLTLVNINLLSDSYGFAVVPSAAYAQISGFSIDGRFVVTRDFGADEHCERGRSILRQHGVIT